MPQRHTDKAPALSRTSRQRGETNGGDDGEVANGQSPIPRARVPVGLVHHPAGTSRATGQAMADIPSGRLCQSRTRARSSLERKFQGPSPPCQRDACSGKKRRTRRRKEPHKLLRQVASGASSETSITRPGGSNPDRRRSLGFLTSIDHPHPEGAGLARPRGARPQIHQCRGMLRGPRFTRAPQHEGVEVPAVPTSPPCGRGYKIEGLARSGLNLRFCW